MMKKYIQIIVFILFMLSYSFVLFGCSEQKPQDAIITYPEDISAITDFKCVCSTDVETEFVIEDDIAKELYNYIAEQREKSEETEIDRTEQDCIYLSFQDGEPLLVLNQELKTKISDELTISEEHFYGVFWICENDYLVYTATPMTSFQRYYKMPEGTYKKISEMVATP